MAFTYTTIDGQRVQTDVANAFGNLNRAFQAAFGVSLRVRSGTRTPQEQINIFLSRYRVQASGSGPYSDVRWWQGRRYVRHSGAGTVAVPGSSNHEEDGPVGPRALDIYDTGGDAGVTTAGTRRANWIKNFAENHGFKPAGYGFGEPWHIEYTGGFGGVIGSPAGGIEDSSVYGQWGGKPWVIAIQQKLIRLGYDLGPWGADGDPGAATRAAIVAFQGKHGLPTDGVAGPQTNAKMDEVLTAPAAGNGGLAVDGQWGEATTRKLQSVLGVTVDGQLGAETYKALQARLNVTADGEFGPQSIAALQTVIGASADGVMGPNTVSALQTYLNNGGTFLAVPPPVVPPTEAERLTEDGQWGPATTKAIQIKLAVSPADGELGPVTIKALQKALGQIDDGQMSSRTIKALQRNVGVPEDGSLGPVTVTALQVFLNANRYFLPVVIEESPVVTYPKPEAPTYPGATYWNHSPYATPRNETPITHFYIHHAADTNPVEKQIERFMNPNDRNVSCTWFIGSDGSVSEIVPPDKWAPWTTPGNNMYSVSVETQDTSREPNWGISEESHVAIAKLVAWSHLRWGIPLDRDHIKGHREAPNVPATACPGPSMNLDKILAYAIKFVEDVTVPPVEPPVEPETWTLTLPKEEAEALGAALDKLRGLLP